MKKIFKVFVLVIFAFVISGCSSYSNNLKAVGTNLSVASFYNQHYLSKLSVIHQNLPNAVGVFEEKNVPQTPEEITLKTTRSMYFTIEYLAVISSVLEEEIIVSAMDFILSGTANSEIKERYYEYNYTYPIESSSNQTQKKHVVKVKHSNASFVTYFWETNADTNVLTLDETSEGVVITTFKLNASKDYKYDRQTKQYSNILMSASGNDAKLNFCYIPEKGYLNFSYADSTATNIISKTICTYQNGVICASAQFSVANGNEVLNIITEHLIKANYERIKIGTLSTDKSYVNNLTSVEEVSLANKNPSDGIGYVFTSDNTKETPSESVVPYGVIDEK